MPVAERKAAEKGVELILLVDLVCPSKVGDCGSFKMVDTPTEPVPGVLRGAKAADKIRGTSWTSSSSCPWLGAGPLPTLRITTPPSCSGSLSTSGRPLGRRVVRVGASLGVGVLPGLSAPLPLLGSGGSTMG